MTTYETSETATPPHATYSMTVSVTLEGITAPMAISASSVNEVRRTVRLLQANGLIAEQPATTGTSDAAPLCPDHGSAMRKGNYGWFCPRKTETGEYCTHKIKG